MGLSAESLPFLPDLLIGQRNKTAILFHGGSFGLIIATMTSLVLVVVTNLAALPTKYTIPFFLLGIAIDVVVIGLSFFIR